MKFTHFIIACTAGIFIYLLLIAVYSEQGYLALQEKYSFKERLLQHIEELEYLQGDLVNNVLAMEQNIEILNREAQRYGYLKNEQILIRLPKSDPSIRSTSPGKFIFLPIYTSPPSGYYGAAGLCSFFLVWIVLHLADQKIKKHGAVSQT